MRAGLIFDLDGVLTDTEELHFRSWQRLADELGLTFDRPASERLRGRAREDALELFLAGRLPGGDRAELLERKNRYFLELTGSLGPEMLLPGVARLLDEARYQDVPMGLASSSRNARHICRRLAILDRFTAFIDGCSGLRPKPAPDVFVWAAGRLGLTPSNCTVIEDSTAGVEAALTGGFRVVGLGPADRVGAAHQVLPGLACTSVAELLGLPAMKAELP